MRAGGQRNLAAISRELAAYFSLKITPGWNRVFVCFYWIKKPKFNDVCVLFKHSNFCSIMVEMHSAKRPRFQTFQKLAPLRQVFSFSTYSKAFATYLKSYIMKPRASRNVGCFLRLRGEKQGEESRQFPLPFPSFPHPFYCPRVFSSQTSASI